MKQLILVKLFWIDTKKIKRNLIKYKQQEVSIDY